MTNDQWLSWQLFRLQAPRRAAPSANAVLAPSAAMAGDHSTTAPHAAAKRRPVKMCKHCETTPAQNATKFKGLCQVCYGKSQGNPVRTPPRRRDAGELLAAAATRPRTMCKVCQKTPARKAGMCQSCEEKSKGKVPKSASGATKKLRRVCGKHAAGDRCDGPECTARCAAGLPRRQRQSGCKNMCKMCYDKSQGKGTKGSRGSSKKLQRICGTHAPAGFCNGPLCSERLAAGAKRLKIQAGYGGFCKVLLSNG